MVRITLAVGAAVCASPTVNHVHKHKESLGNNSVQKAERVHCYCTVLCCTVLYCAGGRGGGEEASSAACI
ncbi:predicted protein [Pyrenophora tritici-repentis Pt-1C-BFP]|uniref:Uncharacterized protein n=1 Tax=Pyrenophora tritici-repentis (strain Pt-1C-BFP) TaxID=426418 RepID=B2W0C8_PYRTR|nr:uncharacterized protein PTRG_03913 [Pyrenophora tritici-repentis Pt-1C-BFP]EDU46751.1 predicted protein [Pyrenophora tritici-repentis Pt-1C-BFP]